MLFKGTFHALDICLIVFITGRVKFAGLLWASGVFQGWPRIATAVAIRCTVELQHQGIPLCGRRARPHGYCRQHLQLL